MEPTSDAASDVTAQAPASFSNQPDDALLLEVWLLAFRLARHRGANRPDSEDIAQTVVLHYWRRRAKVLNVRAWVTAVVARRALRLTTRARREPQLRDEEAAGIEPDLQWEREADLARVVSYLAPRDALLLRLGLNGAAHRLIALRLGLPVSAVGAYMARARDRVRRRLAMGADLEKVRTSR